MGIYLHGWIEVEAISGHWIGVIKIQSLLWMDLGGGILDELYKLAEGPGLPPDVSDEVRQEDLAKHTYYVTWDKVWKVDTDRVGKSWWILHEMVGALQQTDMGIKTLSADKIRLVFWAG